MAQPLQLYPKIGAGSPEHTSKAGVWVALEKIHGAQVVIGVTEDEIRFGKRKAWLQATDPFFGWQLLRSELEVAARALHRAMGLRAATLSIYGELFGGAYPHSEVAAVPGMAPVQTGIWRWPFHGRCKASPRNKKRG